MTEIITTATNFCDRGSLEAGGLLRISDHHVLFSLYGNRYGGDARTSVGVPDIQYANNVDDLHWCVVNDGVRPKFNPDQIASTGYVIADTSWNYGYDREVKIFTAWFPGAWRSCPDGFKKLIQPPNFSSKYARNPLAAEHIDTFT